MDYIADAVALLQGKEDVDALLAHTTPLTWQHIGFSGDFVWDLRRGDHLQKALAQSAPHARGHLRTAVLEKFPLNVVYPTIDAMTSRLGVASDPYTDDDVDPMPIGKNVIKLG